MGVAISHSGNGRVLQGMDLLNNVTTPQFAALHDFIEDSFERIDLSNPQAYLVYIYFDMDDMMLMKQYSGIIQVGDPDELAKLEHIDMKPHKDGFLYTYVTNRSVGKVNFDNLRVRYWKPKVRVQYDYYPYGLPWENPATTGEDALHDYLYQDKEFQFKDFEDGNKGLMLYDFHARMYDPATATWSVPDPAAQCSNPYLAMGNTPVIYLDPDGEFVFTAAALIAAPFTAGASLAFLPAAIGADIGMWSGGSMANGTMNPFKWDYGSGKTWGYMAGGAVVGATSGYVGGAIATSGIPMANTVSIAGASLVNSFGTNLYTGGKSDMSISFGVASYNMSQNEWGYLGKKGNSTMANIGYGLGAVANLIDIKNFVTWDVLSNQGKVDKLSKIYGNQKIKYDPNTSKSAYYDPNTDIITFGRRALRQGKGWAKSTYEHEALHRADYAVQPDMSHVNSVDEYTGLLESRAYRLELDRSSINSLSYRQHNWLINKYNFYSGQAGISTSSIPKFTISQWLRNLYVP